MAELSPDGARGFTWVAAVGQLAVVSHGEGRGGVGCSEPEDGVQCERLGLVVCPDKEIVDVDDDAVWGGGVGVVR